MKILHLFITVLIATVCVAFPTPQEVVKSDVPEPAIVLAEKPAEVKVEQPAAVKLEKPVAVTVVEPAKHIAADKDEVRMVEKIEIHVEVKAVPAEMKIPAVVEVSEVQEHKEMAPKVVEPTVVAKTTEAKDEPKVTKEAPKEAKDEVVESTPKEVPAVAPKLSTEDSTKKEDEKVPVVTAVEKETTNVKAVEAKAEDTKPEAKLDVVETPKVQEEPKIIRSVAEQIDHIVEASSNAKLVVEADPKPKVEEPAAEAVIEVEKPQDEKLIVKKESDDVAPNTETKLVENVKALDVADSASADKLKEVPVKTFAQAVDEIKKEILAEAKVNPEVLADEAKKPESKVEDQEKNVEVKSEVAEPKIVPIIEDLAKETKQVEAEPTYRAIPVAVIADETNQKEQAKEVKVAEKTETVDATAKVSSETKSTEETPSVKAVKTEEQEKVVKVDTPTPAVKAAESPAEKQEPAKVGSAESIVFIVEPKRAKDETKDTKSEPTVETAEKENSEVKVADEPESTVENSAKEVKDSETKTAEQPKDVAPSEPAGSSTKASTKSDVLKKEVEDKGDGDSSAAKSSEELKKDPEEKAEDVVAPVKAEGKKGKKKLPANIRGYRKRLQQEQQKS